MKEDLQPLSETRESEPDTAALEVRSVDAGFAFGGFLLQPDGTLLRGETVVHLPPRELAALRFLLSRAGQIVTPLELRRVLWGDVHVTADSIPKCLSSLRALLEPEQFIQTIYKRGYRFSAQVSRRGAAAGGVLPRLAVLPFEAGYSIPEHLGPVIAEETICRLTRAPHPIASMLARDSVFTLARRGLTAQRIGEMLKADLVLTGTLRALPSHFRLRAEMIRVEDGTQLWVEDLIVPQSQTAGLESELVDRLVLRLSTRIPNIPRTHREASPEGGNLSLQAEASERPLVAQEEHREAYEIFQRAHHEWQTMQRHQMQDGLQHLLRAIDLDPFLFAARVDLVNLCVTQSFYGYMSPAVAASQVRQVANSGSPDAQSGYPAGLGRWGDDSGSPAIPARRRSVAARGDQESTQTLPHHAEAILPALGWVSFHVDHDLPAALHAFSVSRHLPHDPWTTRLRVMFALSRHRFDNAIELLRAAIQLDPFSPWLHARMAWALHLAGHADESVSCAHAALTLFPDHECANLYGSIIVAFNGDPARGTLLARDLAQRLPYFDLATAVHAYALACAGRADEARALLERLQWMSRERFVLSSFTPAVHVALGDFDAALSELRAAADTRCPWFFQMLADPRLKPLHSRPEFKELQALLTNMEDAAASAA